MQQGYETSVSVYERSAYMLESDFQAFMTSILPQSDSTYLQAFKQVMHVIILANIALITSIVAGTMLGTVIHTVLQHVTFFIH